MITVLSDKAFLYLAASCHERNNTFIYNYLQEGLESVEKSLKIRLRLRAGVGLRTRHYGRECVCDLKLSVTKKIAV